MSASCVYGGGEGEETLDGTQQVANSGGRRLIRGVRARPPALDESPRAFCHRSLRVYSRITWPKALIREQCRVRVCVKDRSGRCTAGDRGRYSSDEEIKLKKKKSRNFCHDNIYYRLYDARVIFTDTTASNYNARTIRRQSGLEPISSWGSIRKFVNNTLRIAYQYDV